MLEALVVRSCDTANNDPRRYVGDGHYGRRPEPDQLGQVDTTFSYSMSKALYSIDWNGAATDGFGP